MYFIDGFQNIEMIILKLFYKTIELLKKNKNKFINGL